jgi:hypothetical protein
LVSVLLTKYYSGEQIEKKEMDRPYSTHGFLVRKREGKRSLEKPRRRWKDNVKIDYQEVELEMWIGLMWLW